MDRTSETPMSQEQDITGLVRCAVNGDVEAYGKLYNLCLERIYRYVFNQIRNQMLAEDITEEVFIKAWKAIKTCRGKESTFIPWLYRIAHNQTVDTLRRSPQDFPLEAALKVKTEDAARVAESSMETQRILEIIATLPAQQRQLLILKFMNGADNAEIEQIMGKQPGTVRVLQMRALKNLKQRLDIEGSGYEK
jgi:RNA polymerase sigma-70 factor, ECF subfamily